MSILYQKTSKEFYHLIKFHKSIMNSEVRSTKKANLKNFAIFTAKQEKIT